MVCGVIFFPEILHFRFPHSIVTIQAKTCEIIHISYDEVSDQFRAVGECAEYIQKLSELPPLIKMVPHNLRLRKFHSQADVASLC